MEIKMDGEKITYSHIISLGFFCSVALETERAGLRDSSMPFDWLISSWKGVEELIGNSFEDFLEYDLLVQNSEQLQQYKNTKYNVQFFHDFNKYESLSKQLPECSAKYKRRIEKFYENIKKPTLFIRYIETLKELRYIEENISKIQELLKKFNKSNHIIFIANNEIKSNIIEIFNVEKDENDSVCRKPLEQNRQLYEYLINSYDKKKITHNKSVYEKKQKVNSNVFNKINKKITKLIKKVLFKEYIHTHQF